MQEAIGAKIRAFLAGVDLNDCKIVNKSIYKPAENKLSSTYDIRFHRLEVKDVGCIADVNELVLLVNPNGPSISDVVVGNSHEDNSSFVFITNIKRFGTLFRILAKDLRALAGGVRLLRTGEERYCDVGAVIRPYTSHRLPGVLLHRTWHGHVPGVDFTSVNEATVNNMESTPVLSISNENYVISSFPRSLFHLKDQVPRGTCTRWNAIVCTTSKKNDGNVLFTARIPIVSFGDSTITILLYNFVIRTFDTIRDI